MPVRAQRTPACGCPAQPGISVCWLFAAPSGCCCIYTSTEGLDSAAPSLSPPVSPQDNQREGNRKPCCGRSHPPPPRHRARTNARVSRRRRRWRRLGVALAVAVAQRASAAVARTGAARMPHHVAAPPCLACPRAAHPHACPRRRLALGVAAAPGVPAAAARRRVRGRSAAVVVVVALAVFLGPPHGLAVVAPAPARTPPAAAGGGGGGFLGALPIFSIFLPLQPTPTPTATKPPPPRTPAAAEARCVAGSAVQRSGAAASSANDRRRVARNPGGRAAGQRGAEAAAAATEGDERPAPQGSHAHRAEAAHALSGHPPGGRCLGVVGGNGGGAARRNPTRARRRARGEPSGCGCGCDARAGRRRRRRRASERRIQRPAAQLLGGNDGARQQQRVFEARAVAIHLSALLREAQPRQGRRPCVHPRARPRPRSLGLR